MRQRATIIRYRLFVKVPQLFLHMKQPVEDSLDSHSTIIPASADIWTLSFWTCRTKCKE